MTLLAPIYRPATSLAFEEISCYHQRSATMVGTVEANRLAVQLASWWQKRPADTRTSRLTGYVDATLACYRNSGTVPRRPSKRRCQPVLIPLVFRGSFPSGHQNLRYATVPFVSRALRIVGRWGSNVVSHPRRITASKVTLKP
jgi:hypothetical protein